MCEAILRTTNTSQLIGTTMDDTFDYGDTCICFISHVAKNRLWRTIFCGISARHHGYIIIASQPQAYPPKGVIITPTLILSEINYVQVSPLSYVLSR